MAKTVLVRRTDREIQGLVMEALSRTQMPVTFCGWTYVEELDETELIIATPWYDTKGLAAVASALVDALRAAGVYEEIPIRRLYLKSPSDPLVQDLERKAGAEGLVDVIGHKNGSYSVVFAPLGATGGPVPARHFEAKLEAEHFLLDKLRLSPRAVEEAVFEAEQHGGGRDHSTIQPNTIAALGTCAASQADSGRQPVDK